MENKFPSIILGATGLIGQQFIRILANHPFFEIKGLYATKKSKNKTLKDFWSLPKFHVPLSVSEQKIKDIDDLAKEDSNYNIVFSALPRDASFDIELKLREQGKFVFSNSSSHRMDEEVPILIPEVNPDHLLLAEKQKEKYKGFIITNSNCSVAGLAIIINEIMKHSKLEDVFVTTYQAKSGAGLRGLSNKEYSNNVVPYIEDEEKKIEYEGYKIFSKLDKKGVVPPKLTFMQIVQG